MSDDSNNIPPENSAGPTTKNLNTINCTPKLVCINYPGIVNNVDRAIETLGGIGSIEIATGSTKRNLDLHFRPRDYYSKGCAADKDLKPSILVKIKTRKKSVDGKTVEGTQEILDYDVLGITALSFKFNKLCDFQYLPLQAKQHVEVEDELEYLYSQIIPDELPDLNWLTKDESTNMPFYFPPSQFSKFNSSKNALYFDRSKFYEGRFTPEYYKKFKEQELQQKIHRKDKDRNILNQGGFFCNFEDDVPLTPPQSAVEKCAMKYTKQGAEVKLKELFEQRPIWSKQALLHHLDISVEQMKHLLPTFAFYYVSGPWRVMWVKFGYDPRKDPSARVYQTFDYRVRSRGGFKLKVRAKRAYTSNSIFAMKDGAKFSLTDDYQSKEVKRVQENAYCLKPGMIPSARQMFYQYCDIHLPEIQTMLARLPPVHAATKCNKKNGWLPSGFTEQCREIANKYIGAQVKKELITERENVEETESVEQKKDADDEGEESPNEYFEISDTSSSSSDSEDENATSKPTEDNPESENEIDLETVEEVNRIISMSSSSAGSKQFVADVAQPGPSRIT